MFSTMTVYNRRTRKSASRAWDGIWYVYDEAGQWTGASAGSRGAAVRLIAR